MNHFNFILGLAIVILCVYSENEELKPKDNFFRNQTIRDTDDTSVFTVLSIRATKQFFVVKGSKPIQLSQKDLIEIDNILLICINDHNKLDTSRTNIMELANYKRQYVPYKINGERKVFVNCFSKYMQDFPHWKKYFVAVDGGGKAFFSLTINLTKKDYSGYWINTPL
jgi:hypothetical protein